MNWMRWRQLMYAISVTALLLAAWPLASGKLKPSLEFTGGSRWVISTTAPEESVLTNLAGKLDEAKLSYEPIKVRGAGEYEVLLQSIDNTQKQTIGMALQETVEQPVQEVEFQTVGPTLGKELLQKTAIAIVAGIAFILVYLWWQFRDWRFGLAGVAAMLHDSFILIGAFGWLGWWLDVRVDILFVTALLTTLSFSVHDTIVIFNQLQEIQKTHRLSDPAAGANLAVTQTLPRSLNNSLTILFMLASLILLGGESLRWFAVALFVGTVTGTYSSTFTALPLYVDLRRKFS